jgi:hypothetical protein
MRAQDQLAGPVEDHPLQLAPVILTRELVEFHTEDISARTTHTGPYYTVTRDGLTRITKDGNHVATITQGRWALLTAAYDLEVDSEEMCRALPLGPLPWNNRNRLEGSPQHSSGTELSKSQDLNA